MNYNSFQIFIHHKILYGKNKARIKKVRNMEKHQLLFDKIYTEYKSKDQSEMEELDKTRFKQLPELQDIIKKFLDKKTNLIDFKSTLDSALKRNRGIWGFSGFSGQMFFNMLVNSSVDVPKLAQLLMNLIKIPNDLEDAKKKIKLLRDYILKIQELAEKKSKAPNMGHIPFFLSFLWQIQDKEAFPTYYKKSIEKLEELNILENLWEKELDECYEQFYQITQKFKNYIETKEDIQLTLYDIEHMFYHYGEADELIENENKEPMNEQVECFDELEFVAPYFRDLEKISRSDDRKDVKIFEQKIGKLFEVIGYDVDYLGQGSGREPDGIAFTDTERYCIIFDAKCRSDYYSIGTDYRAIIEYIKRKMKKYGKRYDKYYFIIISSSFKENENEKIKLIKKDSAVHSVIMITAANLLKLLDQRFKLNLDLEDIETNFLMFDGLITDDMFQE